MSGITDLVAACLAAARQNKKSACTERALRVWVLQIFGWYFGSMNLAGDTLADGRVDSTPDHDFESM